MKRRLQRSFVLLIVALAATSQVASAAAGSKPEFHRGFYIEVGSFAPLDVKTTLGLSIPEFDFDEEIDFASVLETSQKPDRARFRGGIRFNRRHELEFSYVSVRRQSDVFFEETVQFLNQEFTVNLDVHTLLETEDLELGYKYFIVVKPVGEFGFSVGLHAVQTEFALEASASVMPAFPGIVDQAVSEADSFDVPLPYLGLFFDLKLGQKLYLGALGKVLDIEIDEYAGNWYTFEVTLEHWTFKHLGFGVGYYFNKLDVTRSGVTDFEINGLKMEQSGVQAYIRLNT